MKKPYDTESVIDQPHKRKKPGSAFFVYVCPRCLFTVEYTERIDEEFLDNGDPVGRRVAHTNQDRDLCLECADQVEGD